MNCQYSPVGRSTSVYDCVLDILRWIRKIQDMDLYNVLICMLYLRDNQCLQHIQVYNLEELLYSFEGRNKKLDHWFHGKLNKVHKVMDYMDLYEVVVSRP